MDVDRPQMSGEKSKAARSYSTKSPTVFQRQENQQSKEPRMFEMLSSRAKATEPTVVSRRSYITSRSPRREPVPSTAPVIFPKEQTQSELEVDEHNKPNETIEVAHGGLPRSKSGRLLSPYFSRLPWKPPSYLSNQPFSGEPALSWPPVRRRKRKDKSKCKNIQRSSDNVFVDESLLYEEEKQAADDTTSTTSSTATGSISIAKLPARTQPIKRDEDHLFGASASMK